MGLLDEIMGSMQPTEQDRQAALAQFMANMGVGLLGNRNWQQGISQGAQQGMHAYQDTLASGPRSRMAAFDAQGKAVDLATKLQGYRDDEAERGAMGTFRAKTPWEQAAGSVPNLAPTPDNAAAFAGAVDRQPRNRTFDVLTQQAEHLESQGLWDRAAKRRAEAEKYRPKVDTTPRVGYDETQGKRVAYTLDDQGNYRGLPVAPDLEKLHFESNGQRVGIGLDPFTGAQRSQGVQNFMTPDAAASNQLGWANNRVSRDRLTFDQDKERREQSQAGAFPKLDSASLDAIKNAREAADKASALGDLAGQFASLNAVQPTGSGIDRASWTPTLNPNKQAMEALTAQLIPMNRQAGSGNMSDKDAVMFERAMPSIGKGSSVNNSIVAGMQMRQQIANDRVAFLETWAQAKGTTLGADQAWRTYLRDNSIFVYDGKSSPLAPKLNHDRVSWQDYFSGNRQPTPAPAARAQQPQRPPSLGDIEAEIRRRGLGQ